MKRKGFTLIELLAVIVILAILTVIAVPKMLDVIENSRRKAWGESAGLMAKAAELKYSEASLINEEKDEKYIFENGDFKSDSPTLTFKGDKPYSGIIVLEKGKTTLALINPSRKYCAIKNEGERIAKVYKIGDEITEEECVIGYTGEKDDEETYTCPDINTYPGEDLTSADTKGYEFSEDKTTITGYTGETGENIDLIIPKSIDGTIITGISTGVFSGKTFNSITISPNITSINSSVLSGATVNKLNLDYATGLESLSLLNLKSNDVVIACSNNLTTINYSMGSSIDNLEIKNLENLKTLSDFTGATIKNMTLDNIPITSLNMSDVNSGSFESLTLKNLSELKTIEENAFKGTSLTSLTLNEKNVPNLETIGNNAFATDADSEKKIESLTLSNLSKLTTIGEGAFSNQSISKLTIKGLSNLETIGSRAFENNKISEISFNEMQKVTTIGNNAFISNPLTKLDFSKATNLETIGKSAFASNKTFENINFSGLTQSISGTLVETVGNVDTLNFSNTGENMENFINDNISVFTTVKNIKLNNSKITKLTLQARNIETIDLEGSSIESFIDSNGSNNISKLDFSNLSNLKTIDINSEKNLSTLNVKGASNLESITCTSCTSLTKLDTGGLTNLTKIYIPSSQKVTTVRISESVPATNNQSLFITSDNLTCVQIDGDSTRFNTNFNTFFPSVNSDVVKTTCNFD